MRKLVLSTLASLAIAFAMVVNVEPAQAGPKFTLCVEGVCLGKGGVEPRYSDENYGYESWEEFCYDNPDHWRCNPYYERRHLRRHDHGRHHLPHKKHHDR